MFPRARFKGDVFSDQDAAAFDPMGVRPENELDWVAMAVAKAECYGLEAYLRRLLTTVRCRPAPGWLRSSVIPEVDLDRPQDTEQPIATSARVLSAHLRGKLVAGWRCIPDSPATPGLRGLLLFTDGHALPLRWPAWFEDEAPSYLAAAKGTFLADVGPMIDEAGQSYLHCHFPPDQRMAQVLTAGTALFADEVVSIPLDIDLQHTVICPRDLFDGHRPYPLPENPASVIRPHVLGRQVVAWDEGLSAYWIPSVWLAGDIRLPLIPAHYAPRLEKETAARLMGARVIRVEDCREGVEFEFDRPLGLTSGREDQPSEAASSLGYRTLVLSPLTALIVSP